MFAFFKREPEPDMIRLDTHKEIVAEIEKDAQAERETVARILQRNIELRGRVDVLEAANHGLLRDKIAESKRADNLSGQLDEVLKTIDDLRPDADKYRERLRRDRENAAVKRAKAGVVA